MKYCGIHSKETKLEILKKLTANAKKELGEL